MGLKSADESPRFYLWQREIIDKMVEATKRGERIIVLMPPRRTGMRAARAEIERILAPRSTTPEDAT